MNNAKFIEFVKRLCESPGLFTGGSVIETIAFLDGRRFFSNTPISSRKFDEYVCILNGIPRNYVWNYAIRECTTNDKEAFAMIEKCILDFVELKQTMSEEEILNFAARQLPAPEGEPEKVFREFDKALLYGDESTIKRLIDENPNSKVLWQGAYPKDVASKLFEISTNSPVKCIKNNDEGTKVKIIAQGWPFQIEMNCKDGKWKINAEKIISLRMSNSKSSS